MSIFDTVFIKRSLSRVFGGRKMPRMISGLIKGDDYSSYNVRGRDNTITKNTSILSSVGIDISGRENEVVFGDGSKITGLDVYIRGNNNKIKIGEKCRFVKGGSLWIEDNGCEIDVGDLTSFISAHLAVTESGSKISIGRDCMFAYDIDVRTGDSHSIIDVDSGKRINHAADVRIGNHVWVASHVMILKGVNILDDCIIGAGSVVARSVDQKNVIYAGNPARVVKKNISWSRERL